MNILLTPVHKHSTPQDYGILKVEVISSRPSLSLMKKITVNGIPVGFPVPENLILAFQLMDKQRDTHPAGWKLGNDTIGSKVQNRKEH